ncbi:CDP-alcohol phosphatidyltransferase family protein [Filimonas effusa]|uniref:CDP-alcohol phosphatidyltransferase family protein n=1 Tax=Filimonas effusa TaxID=2508721 RepID=A0A4Q1DDW0_9BACT|nr:CDP-alcohol phosphatidyltransferase family protein [Filimonas effusa]RXK87075.1 CDP-alcohol phosphatidyltransferase family protein [Filimonas effusa]
MINVKYIPNLLSAARILLSVSLLFLFEHTPAFLVVYGVAGLTDILDGTIARKYKVQSSAGARLDSIGDLFYFVILVIYLVAEHGNVMLSYITVIAVVFLLRILNIIVGFVKYKRLIMIHTIANKTAGLLVFLLPVVLLAANKSLLAVVSIVALVASIEEFIMIISSPRDKIDLNQKSILHPRSN